MVCAMLVAGLVDFHLLLVLCNGPTGSLVDFSFLIFTYFFVSIIMIYLLTILPRQVSVSGSNTAQGKKKR